MVEGEPRRTIDFWVRFNRPGVDEFWLLDDSDDPADEAEALEADVGRLSRSFPEHVRGTAVRLIRRHSLLTWSTPIANWAQLVPYLVTWRRFSDPLLAQSIVVYLGQLRTLDDVLARFNEHDSAMAEAALYSLVANGRVVSPDLSTLPLNGLTRFRRA